MVRPMGDCVSVMRGAHLRMRGEASQREVHDARAHFSSFDYAGSVRIVYAWGRSITGGANSWREKRHSERRPGKFTCSGGDGAASEIERGIFKQECASGAGDFRAHHAGRAFARRRKDSRGSEGDGKN